jgi:hypothetical protein
MQDKNEISRKPFPKIETLLGYFFKLFFASAADWAYPIVRQFFKRSSFRYAVIRIAFCRVVYILTRDALVLVHGNLQKIYSTTIGKNSTLIIGIQDPEIS